MQESARTLCPCESSRTGDDFIASDEPEPVFVGRTYSYAQSWGRFNIVGLDAAGNLMGIWSGDSRATWHVANLSELTGSGPLAGGLSVYPTIWDATNIFTTSASGELLAIWWHPSLGPGNRQIENFSQLFGGAALSPATLVGWVTPWGSMNIGGLDQDGRLSVYWWNANTRTAENPKGWNVTTLGNTAFDASQRLSAMSSNDQMLRMQIFGVEKETGLLRFTYWDPRLGRDRADADA